MTEDVGIGNELNRLLRQTLMLMLAQGELAQLTHSAFEYTANDIEKSEEEEIEFAYPVGYGTDRQPINITKKYKKSELIEKYKHLAFTQIPTNAIYQLVMIIEAMLTDLVRQIILAYPIKLSEKRQISIKTVLDAKSLPELHLQATDAFLNQLLYKSPRDFAEELERIVSVNVLECPAYHTYVEMKATRDILIHNQGVANDTYVSKAGSHARVQAGYKLPIDQIYFLEVYEACLKFLEWLEVKLHEKWHSSEYVQRSKPKENGKK